MTCVVSRCSIVSVRMSVLIGRRTGGARGPNGRNQAARHDRSRLTCREGMTAGGATPPGPARREPEGTAPRRMRNPAPPRSTHHVRIAGADGLDWTGARWEFTAASASRHLTAALRKDYREHQRLALLPKHRGSVAGA